MRWAPLFQLMIVPSSVLPITASSVESTIAARYSGAHPPSGFMSVRLRQAGRRPGLIRLFATKRSGRPTPGPPRLNDGAALFSARSDVDVHPGDDLVEVGDPWHHEGNALSTGIVVAVRRIGSDGAEARENA